MLTRACHISRNKGFLQLPALRYRHTGSTAATLAADSCNLILKSWPGIYRVGINQAIKYLADSNAYADIARDGKIDRNHWVRYVHTFRRKLLKDPLNCFSGNKELFVKFCEMQAKMIGLDKNSAVSHKSSADWNSPEYAKLAIPKLNNPNDSKGISNDPELAAYLKLFTKAVFENAKRDLSDVITAYDALTKVSDLRIPHEWYPFSRLLKRKIIYHGGPTNSGKTYHALQRLMQADKEKGGGLYCGPLRLLALEIFEKLNREGVYCDLLTGQEKMTVPFASHVSCTVEMVNIAKVYDVAVIDEIQMIGDEHRGSAWTRALQGLHAREIHLCGGMEASNIVESLAHSMGDEFELKRYDRLSNLEISDDSLQGDYSRIRPGDCVVAFSRNDIFSIKRQIEMLTPHKCAVIYGSLPAETRSKQARLFNDEGTGFDVLVASDAIGMGLNLNIRRVIFHTTIKAVVASKNTTALSETGEKLKTYFVDHSSIKQIAGRAGRMSSQYKIGEVTTWQECDLNYVKAVMKYDIPQIKAAGLFPSVEQIDRFSEGLKRMDTGGGTGADDEDEGRMVVASKNAIVVGDGDGTDAEVSDVSDIDETMSVRLSVLLAKFVDLAQMEGRYFLCSHEDMICVSNWLNSIPLTLADRFTFAMAPANTRNDNLMYQLYAYAATYSMKRPVALNCRMASTVPRDIDQLTTLCDKHQVIDLYLWLSLRFPKYFIEREKALEQKRFAVDNIQSTLKLENLGVEYSHSRAYELMRKRFNVDYPEGLPPNGTFVEGIRESVQANIITNSHKSAYEFPHRSLEPSDEVIEKAKRKSYMLKARDGGKDKDMHRAGSRPKNSSGYSNHSKAYGNGHSNSSKAYGNGHSNSSKAYGNGHSNSSKEYGARRRVEGDKKSSYGGEVVVVARVNAL